MIESSPVHQPARLVNIPPFVYSHHMLRPGVFFALMFVRLLTPPPCFCHAHEHEGSQHPHVHTHQLPLPDYDHDDADDAPDPASDAIEVSDDVYLGIAAADAGKPIAADESRMAMFDVVCDVSRSALVHPPFFDPGPPVPLPVLISVQILR